MYETEKRLFGQALADVISKKLDEELLECKETAACSRVHRKCIQYIIRYGESPEELDIHRTMTLCRAENIVYLGNFVAALLQCHLTQPAAHKSLLWQAVAARICIEVDIHSAKIVKRREKF